jgi:hypothetical protein
MAPEQALGLKVDARADLYAVGVVLFELLTGRVPFQADTPSAVLLQHVYRAPPSARELNHELPRAIEAVLARSLTKDPNDRYQRADEMAEALREGLRSVDGLAGATVGSHADGSHGVGPGSPVPPAVTVDRRDATAPRATSAASWAARVRSWPRPVLAAALGLVIVPLALLARGAWSPGRAPEPPAANAAGQPSEQPETEGLTPDADAVPRPASPADTTAPVRPAGPTVPPTPSEPLRAPATPPASQEAAQLPPATPEPPVAPTATTAPEPTTSVAAPSPSPSPSPARTPPSAPSDLRVAAVDPHSIRLEWDDNSVDELGFTVSNGDTEVTLGRDVTSYVWSRLAPETQMCFTLRAFNDVGRSRSTPDQCATTPGAPATATVKVSSTAIWVDTGITLEPGQQLTINQRAWLMDVRRRGAQHRARWLSGAVAGQLPQP